MAKPIERCTLAPGLEIARVLTGLWQIADMERGGTVLDPTSTAQAMLPYIDAGFTTFDMADHYGSAELIAGALPRSLRTGGKVQLLTKWVPQPGPRSREEVRAAVQRALDRLASERIDLLQYHAWSYADPSYLDTLFQLQELKREGLIGHLGLTNVDTAHLRIILESGIEVVSNQVCFSLLDRRALDRMCALCVDRGVKLLAFGTLAGGFLSECYLGAADPGSDSSASWSRMKYRRFIDVGGGWVRFQELLTVLQRIARRNRVSIANVACRWVLDQPAVGGIIVGARLGESEHIDANRQLFGFSLDDRDRQEIDTATSNLDAIPGDCGDEYRKPPFLTASGDLQHHVESFPAPYPTCDGPDGRCRASSGTAWEGIGGYCRALRSGSRILVSGTTATHGEHPIGGDDVVAQTHFVIDKIEGALQSLGAGLADVIRTRVYVRDVADAEAVARVHGERFGEHPPANTLVRAELVGERYRVEMEAEAEVQRDEA